MTWPFPTVTNPRTPVACQPVQPRQARKAAQATPQRKPRAPYPADAAEALI